MDFWNKAPFLRLVIPLIFGIVFEIHHWVPVTAMVTICLCAVLGFAVLSLFPRRTWRFGVNRVTGLTAIIAVWAGGYLLSWSNRSINHASHFSNYLDKGEVKMVGVIIDPPQEKARSVKAFLRVQKVYQNGDAKDVQGNLLLYFQKSGEALALQYGDRVAINCIAQEVELPANPDQFNFKEYLSNNDIYHQSYVRTQSWQKISENQANPVKWAAYSFRKKLLRSLDKYIEDEQHLAIASALILGYKDRLDPDVLRSFSAAGAMHVLAVSGLHVGIIFLLINFLLKPLDSRGGRWPWVRAGVLLLALWAYAFLTGLSPSVERAATMFSFVAIGSAVNRPTNIYNTLSASAFLLILIDPLIITKVGFQLSYLAVVGIVYLQPRFYSWLYFKNWILDKVWAITCVSFAAQIATFPLGLYYFHQFPNYFFVSNLVVIPMATFILYAGILLLIGDAVGVAEPFAWALDGFLWFLNESVLWVESIPYSLMYGNFIDVWELLLLYLAIAFGLAWLALKRKRYLGMLLGLVCALLILSAKGRFENSRQQRFMVYHVPKKSVANLMTGTQNVLIADKEFREDESQQLYYLKHYWYRRGFVDGVGVPPLEDYQGQSVSMHQGLVDFCDKRIYLCTADSTLELLKGRLKVDYMVLSGDRYFDIDRICERVEFAQVILDTSIPERKARTVERLLEERGHSVHNVHEKGAFMASW